MTERQMQIAVFHWLKGKAVVAMPNFTPGKWWECDVWSVSKRGTATEFEIKVSMADFRADTKKESSRVVAGQWVKQAKHSQIGQHQDAPSRFYYVVPDEMKDVEVPEWAGLMTVSPKGWIRVRKIAPTIHDRKASSRHIRQAMLAAWYRYWNLIVKVEKSKLSILTDESDSE